MKGESQECSRLVFKAFNSPEGPPQPGPSPAAFLPPLPQVLSCPSPCRQSAQRLSSRILSAPEWENNYDWKKEKKICLVVQKTCFIWSSLSLLTRSSSFSFSISLNSVSSGSLFLFKRNAVCMIINVNSVLKELMFSFKTTCWVASHSPILNPHYLSLLDSSSWSCPCLLSLCSSPSWNSSSRALACSVSQLSWVG